VKDLIVYLARSLVEQPDAVEVSEYQDGDETVYELKVAPDDLGKVIGKQGKTARALRALVSAAASKKNFRAALEILDD
jgi:uncharacterized protein